MKTQSLFPYLIASATVCLGANALADNAITIFGDASGTMVTYDSNPVITAILSEPGTVNGRTYSSWSFTARDTTGSLVTFGALPSGSTYTPTVGDIVTQSGTYSPFHQIPEIGTLTSITLGSSGNPVPAPKVLSLSAINNATLPQGVAGFYIEIKNATISGATGLFGTANQSLTVSDASLPGGMTLFYWPTSYSMANANLANENIPTGTVDIFGIASVFTSGSTSTPEFVPISITAVPEPATLALGGLGALLALAFRSRNKV